MEANGVTSAVVKGLAEILKVRMPEIKAVYDDFPTATQKLDYPCASIFTREPRFTPGQPYVIKRETVAAGDQDYSAPGVDEIAKKRISYTHGKYVFNLQLDLWSRTKFERHKLYESLFRAFSQDTMAAGIRLQLVDYHDQWCAYLLTGLRMMDSEEAVQRGEWRVMVDVVADIRSVTTKLEYPMVTIENTLETPIEIEEPEASASGDPII